MGHRHWVHDYYDQDVSEPARQETVEMIATARAHGKSHEIESLRFRLRAGPELTSAINKMGPTCRANVRALYTGLIEEGLTNDEITKGVREALENQ